MVRWSWPAGFSESVWSCSKDSSDYIRFIWLGSNKSNILKHVSFGGSSSHSYHGRTQQTTKWFLRAGQTPRRFVETPVVFLLHANGPLEEITWNPLVIYNRYENPQFPKEHYLHMVAFWYLCCCTGGIRRVKNIQKWFCLNMSQPRAETFWEWNSGQSRSIKCDTDFFWVVKGVLQAPNDIK